MEDHLPNYIAPCLFKKKKLTNPLQQPPGVDFWVVAHDPALELNVPSKLEFQPPVK